MPPLCSPLCNEDRLALLDRARRAIMEVVRHQRIPELPKPAGRLAEPGGAFVTLRRFERLRGCVGRTDRTLALAEVVAQCAIGAAFHDVRFRPVQEPELREMTIEISVLSDLQPVAPQEIEAGRHGALIRRGERRALLLPQVATEFGWPVERFLAEICRKASLEPDSWKEPETEIFAFTAEVFSETDFFGKEVPGARGAAGMTRNRLA
jgi:AmmeMemoRadiSam system protein A